MDRKEWLESQSAALNQAWGEFNLKFETEAECVEEIYRLGFDQSTECSGCGSTDIDRPYGSRKAKCNECRKIIWRTANTCFQGVHKVRPLLLAVYLWQQGVLLKILTLSKLARIAYSSAWGIWQKLAQVILSEMREDSQAVASAEYIELFAKHSRQTPKESHPREEEADAQGEQQRNEPQETVEEEEPDLSQQSAEARLVFDLVTERPISSADLLEQSQLHISQLNASLVMLQIGQLIEELPGEQFVKVRPQLKRLPGNIASPEVQNKITSFIEQMKWNTQHISRKYLQPYLAAYWCCMEAGSWSKAALLSACLRAQRIKLKEILAYVTPLKVKLGYL